MPSVRVVGLYSPIGNKAEYEAFIANEVAAQNPINFSPETKALLVRLGRGSEIVSLSRNELAEIQEELEHYLSNAALVEVLVDTPDDSFSVDAFHQPAPGVPKSRWQVAWCEKFLTADGQTLLGEFGFGKLPSETVYRVAFYVHDWKQERGLVGPYGPLELPPIQPMPARLWRLAPYEKVD